MSLETKVSSDTEVAEVSSRQETQTAEVVDREKSTVDDENRVVKIPEEERGDDTPYEYKILCLLKEKEAIADLCRVLLEDGSETYSYQFL